MNGQIIAIRHYGIPFRDSAHAVLLATGMTHHYVLLRG